MNINTKGIKVETASITDFDIVAPKLARIVVAYTGRPTRGDLTESLAKQMKYMATPVENSFRMLRANASGGVAVGFVRANQELRPTTDKEIKASYTVMASGRANGGNILMSNDDRTLWEVKNGASGMFLARKGQEDLGELVNACVNRRSDVPRLNQVVSANVAAPREFVAYAAESGDMDYGFCIKASKDGSKLKIVSSTTGRAEVIKATQVATALPVSACAIPRDAHNKVVASGIDRNVDGNQTEYYSRLFGYAPDYLADIKRMINETSAL